MRKIVSRLLAVACVAALALVWSVGVAHAASVHLKGGAHGEPMLVDAGLTLAASGELSGLGNVDVLVTLTAVGNPVATCQNPGTGEHYPPGQNPAPVEVTGSTSIPASEIKNGWTPFSVVTEPPATPVEGAPDCPNPLWTEEITDMAFTAATITVEQPAGTVVLTVACTIDPATVDGPVPGADVDCTSG